MKLNTQHSLLSNSLPFFVPPLHVAFSLCIIMLYTLSLVYDIKLVTCSDNHTPYMQSTGLWTKKIEENATLSK